MHTEYAYSVSMAVRDALLAMLAGEPKHGYQLKAEFDEATGSAWPLNVGQVYTTLQRLERDGFVEAAGEPDGDGRMPYTITPAGRTELAAWFATPVAQPLASRDEVSMKVLLALATGQAPTLDVVAGQRVAAMATLQSLTKMKADADAENLAWRLHLDRMTLLVEAELKWLDLAEQRLLAADQSRPAATPTIPTTPTTGVTK